MRNVDSTQNGTWWMEQASSVTPDGPSISPNEGRVLTRRCLQVPVPVFWNALSLIMLLERRESPSVSVDGDCRAEGAPRLVPCCQPDSRYLLSSHCRS